MCKPATLLHELLEASQKNPVPDQQSTEPHLQTPSFSEAPLPSEQAAAWLQVLEEDVQTSPVAGVQAPEVPQTQGAGLTVAPSPWAQTEPVKAHRHLLLIPQARVDRVFVLNCRGHGVQVEEHPRGLSENQLCTYTLGESDHPTCLAAALHVASCAINLYPVSTHVPEVTMGYTMKLLEVLHWLRGLRQKSPVVAAAQSAVPQAQFAGLAAVPSVVAQGA